MALFPTLKRAFGVPSTGSVSDLKSAMESASSKDTTKKPTPKPTPKPRVKRTPSYSPLGIQAEANVARKTLLGH
jgi:hypothetical protein